MAPPFQLSREGIAEIDGSRVSPDRDEIEEIAEIAEIDGSRVSPAWIVTRGEYTRARDCKLFKGAALCPAESEMALPGEDPGCQELMTWVRGRKYSVSEYALQNNVCS